MDSEEIVAAAKLASENAFVPRRPTENTAGSSGEDSE